MATLTAYIRLSERGLFDKFKAFLKEAAEAENLRISHMQTYAWFRFESRKSVAELDEAARQNGFSADFFDTAYEEGVS